METRIDLAKYFRKCGFKVGAEIGVADGRYSEILCKENPGLKLYCIDSWTPYEGNWRGANYQLNAYKKAEKRLSKYDTVIIPQPSIEASIDFDDGMLDFVFIDGNHIFDHVMADIIIWSRKVKSGGIVAGHDYTHFKNSGVVEAVNKYCEMHRIELRVINRNNSEHKDDRQPCWWFKKE